LQFFQSRPVIAFNATQSFNRQSVVSRATAHARDVSKASFQALSLSARGPRGIVRVLRYVSS
jgi:hypothetical protein